MAPTFQHQRFLPSGSASAQRFRLPLGWASSLRGLVSMAISTAAYQWRQWRRGEGGMPHCGTRPHMPLSAARRRLAYGGGGVTRLPAWPTSRRPHRGGGGGGTAAFTMWRNESGGNGGGQPSGGSERPRQMAAAAIAWRH